LLPVNFTKERLRIMQMIDSESDSEKVKALYIQLNNLDEKEREILKKMENKLNLKNVNKRNAMDDIENVQRAKMQKQKKSSIQKDDPYARRQTKVAVSWIINNKNPGVKEELQPSDKEKQGGEIGEPALKKLKSNSGKGLSRNFNVDLDINSPMTKPSPTPNRGSLKPTTQSNAAPVKTVSLSDYLKRKN